MGLTDEEKMICEDVLVRSGTKAGRVEKKKTGVSLSLGNCVELDTMLAEEQMGSCPRETGVPLATCSPVRQSGTGSKLPVAPETGSFGEAGVK